MMVQRGTIYFTTSRLIERGVAFYPMNKIVIENTHTGSPREEWDIIPPSRYYDTAGLKAGDESIQGFATDISVNVGEAVYFKIKTSPPAASYRLDIYRMGYYGGAGARKMATVYPSVALPQPQPDDLFDEETGLIDCGNWQVSASWDVPSDATSGIYFVKLVRTDEVPGVNHMIFVVRDDDSRSELLFQTSDTTWQAYNLYRSISLYRRPGHPDRRAYKVSYNRPFWTRVDDVQGIDFIKDWVFNAEYPMVRWLERNGYDVSYFTCVDSHRFGDRIREHKVFLSVGHDEYWSAEHRCNVEVARDAGIHIAFFSGNELYYKSRWEASIDGSNTPYRTLVCYKETKNSAKIDPLPNVWTGTWRDPRFSPPADGGYAENALSGTIFTVNNNYGLKTIEISAEEGKLRFWRNTNIAQLAPGMTARLSPGMLGWEWDEDLDNGFRPAGLIHLSTTVVPEMSVSHDYGTSAGFFLDTATHHLTLYRHASGALVFSAATINWAWGLDAEHDLQRKDAQGNDLYPTDQRVQQATVNLLADMGVQPETLQPDLQRATPYPSAAHLSAEITSPTDGATVKRGIPIYIEGLAQAENGIVGGVEVSIDGGATWHPAQGRTSWRYPWIPPRSGTVTILCRALDDIGSIGHPSPGIQVIVAV